MGEQKVRYNYRFLAKIVMEAATALSIGTGQKNMMTKALVTTDVNGLPYIPGTTLAGIIRHAIGEEQAKTFFGYQEEKKSKEGEGSKVIFSEGRMLGVDGCVLDGLQKINFEHDFYRHFNNLPIRQHVKIDDQGVSQDRGKFDEQVVYKGTRFCFEIELLAQEEECTRLDEILNRLYSNVFRVGGGSRSGFGEMKIVECKTKTLNLELKDDLDSYLNKSSNLSNADFWDKIYPVKKDVENHPEWEEYLLELTAEDFFLFGSGFSNDKAKMTPVSEAYIDWSTEKPVFKDDNILIPAASVKGALAHRVAFYWNKLNKRFADNTDKDNQPLVGTENPAVLALFGSEDAEKRLPGNLLISDIIEPPKGETKKKLLNHVSIDRFTGGAIKGALFTEEVTVGNGQSYSLRFFVNKKIFQGDKEIKEESTIPEAFHLALKDLCEEMLPLGGGVNRGNGCFSGELIKPKGLVL